jgi:hypothetical protein
VGFRARFLNVNCAIALLGLSLAGCTTTTQVDVCDPTSLVLHVSGSAVTPGGALPVEIADTLSFARLSSRSFGFLVDVFFRGAGTGSASAVWIVSTPQPPVITLGFQLGGDRKAGSVLPVGGGLAGVSTGEGPAISAIGAAGVLMLLNAPSYSGQGSDGQFTVQQASPLTAQVSAQFADQSARAGSFTGQVRITAGGPNCP